MKADDFMDAMGKIDPQYVQEAEEMPIKKKDNKKYALRIGASLAACAAILVIGKTFIQKSAGQNETSGESALEYAMLESADACTEEDTSAEETFYLNQVKAEEVQKLAAAETEVTKEQEAADTSYVSDNEKNAMVKSDTDELQKIQLPEDFLFLSQLEDGGTVIYSYGNTDGTESLHITIAKEVVSQYGNLLAEEQYQKTEWNGEEVVVLQIDREDHYLAQCQASGKYMEFEAENITEKEFETAVKSFLEEE